MKKWHFPVKYFILIFLSLVLISFCGCEDESIKIMFENYEKAGGKIENIKTIAVLDFLGEKSANSDYTTNLIIERLRTFGYLNIMDTGKSSQILREKGFPTSGIVTQEDARIITEILGVDALVYGKVKASFNSAIRYRETYSEPYYYYRGKTRYRSYRRIYRTPYLNRSGKVKIVIHLYDGKIRNEIGKIELNKSYNRDFEPFYYDRLSRGYVYFYDSLKNTNMPSDIEMIYIMTDRLADKMLISLTSYYVSRTRTLQEGIPGADKGKEGKWDEAKKIWEKSLGESPDDWKVNLNLGIYYERQGNPIRALSYYRKALEKNPELNELNEYIAQVETASVARIGSFPLDISKEEPRYRVADVKNDGRIYINAGKENGIKEGDRFVIARQKIEFNDNLVAFRQFRYYPVGEIVIEQVFEGVSCGRVASSVAGQLVKFGDTAILKKL